MNFRIYRKRYIPDEIVDISDDKMLRFENNILVTKWNTIKPRNDFSWGVSFAYLEEGYKISRFYNEKDEFLFWYIDFVEAHWNQNSDELTLIDLLVDVKIFPDGSWRVLDREELEDCKEKEKITLEQYKKALRSLEKIINMLEKKIFPPPFISEYLSKIPNA